MIDILKQWLKQNKVKFGWNSNNPNLFCIGDKTYLLLEEKNGLIFDQHFQLILSESEKISIADYYIFDFGGKFFYQPKAEKEIKLKLLKYVGQCEQEIDLPFTHLGVHGPYEMLNGAFQYEEWVSKAKFLGHNSLGICEKNSLAGVLMFQQACESGGLKPIIGETITVKLSNELFDFKVFVLDEIGYSNLLKINKFINIDNPDKFIDLHNLQECGKGLICVLPNNIFDIFINKETGQSLIKDWEKAFDGIYYQLDTVIWDNKKFYLKYLENIKKYLENYSSNLQPILLCDSYYLDEDDFEVKQVLNKIGGEGFHNSSRDQYFKNLDDSFKILESYFKETDDRLFDLFKRAVNVTQDIGKEANFKIKTGTFRLPKFTSTHLPSGYKGFEDNEALFKHLLYEGLDKKGLQRNDVYLERLKIEIEVIKKGGFIDYFLILWDIIRFCKEKKILTGLGRGSAAGSLIAYLLDITRIDPLKYDLLFERFLNEGRINSLPDIDTDIATRRRDEVIKYVKDIYGADYFCNVGTYTTLQIKSGLKDLARLKGLNYEDYNNLTTFYLQFQEGKGANIEELFKKGLEIPKVREFIQKNIDLVHTLFKILEQPKAVSVHPCATIIVPKEEGTVFENIPVRKDGDIIISEFQGPDLESMGYLKEDLLALLQLDKFERMLELIKENHNKEIDIYSIPLNEPEVMDMFCKGLNGDVFQFGSEGLTSYSKSVKPDDVNELINMVALFRPGPIGSGAHFSYVKLKNKEREAEYDFGLKDVTKETFGLLIFQEQVMKACQVLGGFNLAETDDVRRAMGKKKESVLKPFKEKFIEGALKQGASEKEASDIWDKLIVFSGYGFNKSHAAVYSITGYISQWFKVHYPVEFWTTALEYSEEEDKLISYVDEINKRGDIQIVPPDINKSEMGFKADAENNKIYWSILKIKFLGEVGTKSLLEERAKNGKYYSIEEFYSRVKDTALDKRQISNLIFSGCFDENYNIRKPSDRLNLLKEYFKIAGIDEGKELWLQDKGIVNEWWWTLKQRELTGLGLFDYRGIISKSPTLKNYYSCYVDYLDLQNTKEDEKVSFGGIIKEARLGKTKKKEDWLLLILDSNGEETFIYMWNPEYLKHKELLSGKLEKKLIILTGIVKIDKFRGGKQIHFYDTQQKNDLEFYYFEDLSQYKPIVKVYNPGDIRTMKDGDYQMQLNGSWKKVKK